MNKLRVVVFIGIGLIVGVVSNHFYSKYVLQQTANYEIAAQQVADTLKNEQFYKEIAAFIHESRAPILEFISTALPACKLTEQELKDLTVCLNDYCDFLELFAQANIQNLKDAWQSVAWQVVDGQLTIDESSYKKAAKEFAFTNSESMAIIKKYLALDHKWHKFLESIYEKISLAVECNPGALTPCYSCMALLAVNVSKYPHLYPVVYTIQDMLRFDYTKKLFLLALKDRLGQNMEHWMPLVMLYLQTGVQGLGHVVEKEINKQS